MDDAKSRYLPALVTGGLLGLLVWLLSMFGALAQDTGSGVPPASLAVDHEKPVAVPTLPPTIIITPTELVIGEPDGADTFTASLTYSPTYLVILPFTAANDECETSLDEVIWPTSNWQHTFVITVTAVDDEIFDGDQICVIETGPATSIDPNYDNLDPPDVTVIVTDDEYLGLVYLPAVLREWPKTPSETEPNDTPPQANGPIASGVTYDGTLMKTTDIKDYFYFELTAAHTVEGWLTNIPAGEDYTLVLRYDDPPDYPVVPGGYHPQPGNADEHILTGVLAPGRYYVQIFNFEAGPGSAQPYHLRVIYE